jgi:hypothetical protein
MNQLARVLWVVVDCFAWRQGVSSLVMSQDPLVQRQIEGSALGVLREVLTWEAPPLSTASG